MKIPYLMCVGVVGMVTAGCFSGVDCDPEPDITVKLEKVSEDVRSLPVLASGKTTLLGLSAPDHHGDIRVQLKMTNTSTVELTSIAFAQSLNAAVKDTRMIAQQLNDKDVKDGATAQSDGTLKFQWRMKNLAEYALTPAAPHSAKATVNWRYSGCRLQTGVATLEVTGEVKAAASAENLSFVSAEAFAPSAVTGARAKVTVKSAVGDGLMNLANPKLQVTYFAEGLTPSVGLGLLATDHLTMQSGGTARTTISSTENLEVYSSKSPTANGAAYEAAGTAVAASTGAGLKALLTLTLSSSKQSQAATTQVDTVHALVDVQ